jgi:transcriptional regulator GlxA family with amidase domain
VDAAFSDPDLCLDDLAERAELSVSQLCLSYKRWFGSPVMAYVRHRRLRHAAMLIGDTRLTLAQVADAVGFRDVYHFAKAYKQFYGHPPGASRRRRG